MKRNYLFKTNYNDCLNNEQVFQNLSDSNKHKAKWLAFLNRNRLDYSVYFYTSNNSEMMRVRWTEGNNKYQYHADWIIEKVAK